MNDIRFKCYCGKDWVFAHWPGRFGMAAACLFYLGRNHPFVDGNKRTVPEPTGACADSRAPGCPPLKNQPRETLNLLQVPA